jgi:hypothetical protein
MVLRLPHPAKVLSPILVTLSGTEIALFTHQFPVISQEPEPVPKPHGFFTGFGVSQS